jgi:hypothetical protein
MYDIKDAFNHLLPVSIVLEYEEEETVVLKKYKKNTTHHSLGENDLGRYFHYYETRDIFVKVNGEEIY